MITLTDDGELALIRLLNALDKLCFHAVPLADWDGKPFEGKEFSDYPAAMEVPDSPAIIADRTFGGTTTIVPTVLLEELWETLAGGNNQLGLEDYITKNQTH